MTTRHLTVADLAARLGLTQNAVYIMNYRGTGPRVTKLGRRVRYTLADVETWERQQHEEALAA